MPSIKLKQSFPSFLYRTLSLAMLLTALYIIGNRTAEVVSVVNTNLSTPSNTQNWGLGFGENNTAPTGTHTIDYLAQYGSYYRQDTEEKVIYLTFDAGFENGNTEPILDALAKHEVPATFFLVGNYLDTEPDLVKRMAEEGHMVGNHSYNHPDMTQKDQEAFTKEMQSMSDYYLEITGQEIAPFYRPPQGKYNEDNLQWAQDMGYSTIFWSLAYVDWYENDQPTKEQAFDKLLNRIHPGAIVLLHNTSKTNGEILDELIVEWKNMGYTFAPLTDLVQ